MTASDEKRYQNLRARCALQGVQLFVTTDDYDRPQWVAVKWALTQAMSTLDEVAAWVHRVDGLKE